MKKILTYDYSVEKHKLHIIPTIIPLVHVAQQKPKKYFLLFGYIVRRKGIEELIDGFKLFLQHYPEYQLILAGGTIKGQEKAQKEIKDYIVSKNLTHSVVLTGFVTQKQIDILYQQACAVVIPAKITMGSSGPLYHAQSYHQAILASDVGHLKEDIQHMSDGLLVQSQSWYRALRQIVEDKVLAATLRNGTRLKAQQKHPQIIAKTYEKIYRC